MSYISKIIGSHDTTTQNSNLARQTVCSKVITLYMLRSSYTHYNDVIIIAMASQITSFTIVYWTVYSRRRSKKASKLCVIGLRAGISPVTGEFPAQRVSNEDNVSIWSRHHDISYFLQTATCDVVFTLPEAVSNGFSELLNRFRKL